ncbi:Kae1-associated kinase Bud32 [Cryptosporidium felis]|nr:Kae1-associated kinase Bud32 [Cryptosporidium felis]
MHFILFCLLALGCLGPLGVFSMLRVSTVEDYLEGYIDKIYLDKDMVYMSVDETYGKHLNHRLRNSLGLEHRRRILGNLGGLERLIELMKLLKNNAQEEEEESIDEGLELKDHFDRLILGSNLDGNYYHYISGTEEKERSFCNHKGLGVNRFRVTFSQVQSKQSFFSKTKYNFKTRVELISDRRDSREPTKNESLRLENKDFIKFTNGYYLANREAFQFSRDSGVRYSLKIESPLEMVDFNELILLERVNLRFNKKAYRKTLIPLQEDLLSENSGAFVKGWSDYEEEEGDDEDQMTQKVKNSLARGYPICELRCTIRELQNKPQWGSGINKLRASGQTGQEYDKYGVKGSNWCNRLVFHNCIDFEVESIEISAMNEALMNRALEIENTLDDQVNRLLEEYFLRTLRRSSRPRMDPEQIGKLIVLSLLLEKNGFVLSINKENSRKLHISYERLSSYSGNLISLKTVLEDVRFRLRTGKPPEEPEDVALLSSLGPTQSRENSYFHSVVPVTNGKFVFDTEQVMIFAQNMIFLLKQEKARSKSGVFLPWYSDTTKDLFIKQNSYINSLLSEYGKLLKFLVGRKFVGKERFYRLSLLNLYSLVSHFKSFEGRGFGRNSGGRGIFFNESRFKVIDLSLSYQDQVRLNHIFRRNIHFRISWNVQVNSRSFNYESLESIREYYSPIDDLEEDSVTLNDGQVQSKVFEVSRLIKRSFDLKGNLDFDSNSLVFQNNMGNFGFNMAFINYVYQQSLNLDDSIITSPPWWMVWQSQFYPRLSLDSSTKESESSLLDNPKDYLRELNSTWLELPINSETPNSFFDSGSFIPKEIVSKEILESIILEEVELVNPVTAQSSGNLGNKGKDGVSELNKIIREKQQAFINNWKKNDVVNDPNNLFFYNIFNRKQGLHTPFSFTSVPTQPQSQTLHLESPSNRSHSSKFNFNPCIINALSEGSNSVWFSNCILKWKIYSGLFEHLNSSNHYLQLSTFFDLLNEIKIILTIQNIGAL